MTIDEMVRQERDPVVMADHDGIITFINERFEHVLGWKRDELVGKPLTMIIPGHLRDAHHLGFSRFLTTEKPTLLQTPLQLKVVTGRGEEIDAEHLILAEKRGPLWVFAASICPTSRRNP